MKAFAAVLTVLLIVGSQATSLEQASPRTKWEAAIEKFWTFSTELAQSTQGLVKQIRSADLDKRLENLISDCLTELNKSTSGLQAQLGPYADRFSSDMDEVRERLNRDLASMRSMLVTYNEEVNLMVKQNVDDVHRTLALYLRKYRKRLNRDQATIRSKFHEYTEMLRNKRERTLSELHAMAAPFATSMGEKVQEHFQDIQESLAQKAKEVRSKAEELQEHLADNTEDLRASLRQKMEELGIWFETEAQQISQRFSDLLDYLQRQVGSTESAETTQQEPAQP
ncbi:apolipoprotein Eb-like [Carcharodon carcharias]|uniref:apolipoprotein Eb-like n=1 Tax=Carcharodon carcharias TaxID=13397 RepID=UPI001B7F77AD|nr:apolipoprotein Eb-like [Carcharodon carcharias]XP_041032571.1 apolipoprotein Eb-like [Carcharodon carcharias]